MSARTRALRYAVLACGLGGVLLTAGCAGSVSLDAAPDATNPKCAEISVRLPQTVAGQQIRQTTAQATAAWGDPAAVVLRCGVAVPGPTTQHCVTADGIDWIIDHTDSKTPLYTTFGRRPATEVMIDHSKVSDATVLSDLAPAIAAVPASKKCLNINDVPASASPTPSPAP